MADMCGTPAPSMVQTCTIRSTYLRRAFLLMVQRYPGKMAILTARYPWGTLFFSGTSSEGNGRLFRELPKLLEKPGVAAPLRIEGLWCRVTTLFRPAHCVYCAGLGWKSGTGWGWYYRLRMDLTSERSIRMQRASWGMEVL